MGNLCLCATEYCPEEEKGCKEGGVTTYTLIWSFLLCALKGTKMQTMKRLSTFQAQDFHVMSRVNYLNFEGTLETGFLNSLFKILPAIFCMPLQTASTHYKCHHLRKPGKNGSNSVGIFFFFPSFFKTKNGIGYCIIATLYAAQGRQKEWNSHPAWFVICRDSTCRPCDNLL